MKKNLIYGGVTGVLAAVAGVIYQNMYQTSMYLDFSMVMNSGAIVGASIFGCLLMGLGYGLLESFDKTNLKGWMNVLIIVLSFASILSPLAATLPLEVDSPELFPGLAIPLHFIPAMVFFGLSPFFQKENNPA